jgi:hypothetical protein
MVFRAALAQRVQLDLIVEAAGVFRDEAAVDEGGDDA